MDIKKLVPQGRNYLEARLMDKLIRLTRGRDAWYAHYFGAGTADLINLMGTHILPTAFLPTSPAHRVVSEIQRLNPEYRVIALD